MTEESKIEFEIQHKYGSYHRSSFFEDYDLAKKFYDVLKTKYDVKFFAIKTTMELLEEHINEH